MIEIMSINSKFMSISPKDLCELVINNSNKVKGFELFVNVDNEDEIKYMNELASVCSKNDLIFQIHGNSGLEMNKQIKFINILEKLDNLFEYKINVVMHPFVRDTKKESIEATTNYLNELTNNIDNSKIIISLENLNDIKMEEDRLNKEDILSIVCNNENVYMTYDIGHEIIDGGFITDINSNLIPLISNVHIHSFDFNYDGGYDHKPILEDDEHWNQIIKGVLFLNNCHYKGRVVFEYDVLACIGDTLEDKIISYIKSMDMVGSHFI